jgi:hypothetical protein
MAVERYDGNDVDALVVATDLTGKEQTFCSLTAAGLVPSGAAARTAGVVLQGAAVGLNASFQFGRIARLKLGGTVAMGDPITPNASGLGVLATTGQSASATAREGGVTGQIISVYLKTFTV